MGCSLREEAAMVYRATMLQLVSDWTFCLKNLLQAHVLVNGRKLATYPERETRAHRIRISAQAAVDLPFETEGRPIPKH
jgi:hypothetical protein